MIDQFVALTFIGINTMLVIAVCWFIGDLNRKWVKLSKDCEGNFEKFNERYWQLNEKIDRLSSRLDSSLAELKLEVANITTSEFKKAFKGMAEAIELGRMDFEFVDKDGNSKVVRLKP